jgi:hypothetical protein
VELLNYQRYFYKNVPLTAFYDLFKAHSTGSHLHRYFKGIYEVETILEGEYAR